MENGERGALMKAYVLNGIGKLDFMDVPKPVLKSGEVLVEVKAAGICGSDIPRIFETGTYHFPTIPGHEFSGIVREIYGDGQKSLLGKRVGVFPLIPCMQCAPCKKKQYEMCMQYDYLGSRRDGGFAEYVAVPARNIVELPEEISFESAAMLEPACVGIHALKQIDIRRVKSAVVFGPGTIGLLMVQWLRVLKVKDICIVGTNDSQKGLAGELGFECFYNGRNEDAVGCILRETAGEGCDLAIECTGFAEVLGDCIKVTKRGGDICVVGNPHGDVTLPKDIYWQLLRKQLRMCGTWNSSYIPEEASDDWRMTLKAIADGQLCPEKQITHRLAFDSLQKGLQMMRDKAEFYNKVMTIL